MTCRLRTVKGRPVWGVTSLAGEIYLLRWKERDQVEVYDVITYRLQRCLTVPDARGFADMTSCEHNRCVYIGGYADECVHKLDVQGAVTRWTVNDKPWGLSVNAAHNVLVACRLVSKIKEFSSDGDLLRVITRDDIIHPSQAIQTRSGQFIVCDGSAILDDPVHRVCMMSDDGRHIVHSHGGQRGSDTGQYHVPRHLAVDNHKLVFVADLINRRVTLLSPTLEYVRQVVSRDQLMWRPSRLFFDKERRHLYVCDNEWDDEYENYIAGRVVIFSV